MEIYKTYRIVKTDNETKVKSYVSGVYHTEELAENVSDRLDRLDDDNSYKVVESNN